MSDLKDKDTIEGGRSRIKFWGGAVIVLMIILMFMPWNIGQNVRNDQYDVLVGTASGGRKVLSGDLQRAQRNLETLEGLFVSIQVDPTDPSSIEDVPLLQALWGPELVAAMKRNEWAYHLLVEESRKFGLGESQRTLGSLDRDSQNARSVGVFNSGQVFIRDLHPLYGSPLYSVQQGALGIRQQVTRIYRPFIQNGTDFQPERRGLSALAPIEQQAIYGALRDLLSVQSAASLAQTAIKPSPVMIDQLIARAGQRFRLNVASIDARPFIDTVTVPSDAELKAQLAKYADRPADEVTAENPFGFGYQIPNAVKLQMIAFSRPEVRAVVESEKTPYEWEVEARMAYARDASQFKSLAPASQPATAPAADPNQVAPFDQIQAAAIRMMVDKATSARVDEITRKTRTTMSLDHQAWLTKQASSLGVGYESLDYLNKLAATIQSEPRFRVLPVVRSEQGSFLGAEELSLNPSLSRLLYRFPVNTARQLGLRTAIVPAAQYIIEFAKPFMDQQMIEKAGGAVLDINKPSDPLSDFNGDTVAFIRLTAAEKAHPATDLDSMRARLTSDVNRANAQTKAIAKANAAAEAIKAGGKFDVAGASSATVDIEPLGFTDQVPPELGLTLNAYEQFHGEVGRNLLGEPDGQPVATISVPLAQKVFVAQRIGLEAVWSDEEQLNLRRIVTTDGVTDRMAEPGSPLNMFGLTDKAVSNDWLSIDAVRARNAWVPATGDKDDDEKHESSDSSKSAGPTTKP
jgi:hypothetical protein